MLTAFLVALGVVSALGCRAGEAPGADPPSVASPNRPGATESASPTAPSDAPEPAAPTLREHALLLPGEDVAGPHPLLVLLHPYGGIADTMLAFHSVAEHARAGGWIVAAPKGDVDRRGMPFWNATEACCDRDAAAPRHTQELRALLEALIATHDVDRSRVVLAGASNGAFMSYRLACEASDLVTGIVALAGSEWLDADRCAPAHPVSVTHIHALDDAVILAAGEDASPLDDTPGAGYPSAEETVGRWAERNACPAPTVDTDSPLGAGTRTRWTGCADGSEVELHLLQRGGHVLLPSTAIGELTRAAVEDRPRQP